ncbi:MAG: GCN5-related N-acetyltransferase [Nitrosospira multiformis]|jgi:hypothetical protein|nr:GCN5-related N-acetyltransferase [Nitrosospira multiformis]
MNRYLSELDQNRFGVITVKAEGLESIEDIEECILFSKNNNADLLIARFDASRINVTQQFETLGGILCDTLIYYELRCHRVKNSITVTYPDKELFRLREVTTKDQVAVTNVAREAFSEYFGHYHSDPMFNRRDCDEVYVSWCETTIKNAGKINKVIVAEDINGICGFLTMKVHNDEYLELVLSGVAKRVEGRGVYRRMIRYAVEDAIRTGFKRVFTSTQIINLAVQRVWIAQGFLPTRFEYTFHKWFKSNIKLLQTTDKLRFG